MLPIKFLSLHFQDYLVMIPEEYYKCTHLRQRVEKPCLIDSQSEFCVDYKYLNIPSDAINVPTSLGQLVGRPTLLPYKPFKSFSVLNPVVRKLCYFRVFCGNNLQTVVVDNKQQKYQRIDSMPRP